MIHGTADEDCKPQFRGVEVHCETHGSQSFPQRYNDKDDSIRYSCGSMNELKVPVGDIPDETLTYIYRKLKKTNHSIIRDGGDKRFEDLIPRLSKDIRSRGLEIPDTSLTHKVTMNKRQAMESDVPVIIKIGRAAGKYELGTKPEEMTWCVLTTKDEATKIEDEFDNIRVQNVTEKTKT